MDEPAGPTCSLSPVELTHRRADLRGVMRRAAGLEETADGVAITFRAGDDTAHAVWEAVMAERRCCSAFRYMITFEPGSDAFILSVVAPEGSAAPLKALYRSLSSGDHSDG